jgi:universal stress protein A
MKIKRILCPVDFSEHSVRAFEYADFLARSHGAKLLLLHVFEHLQGYDHYLILALTPQEIREKMEKAAKDQLKSFMNEVESHTEVEAEVREGKAFVEIVRKAKEEDVDLIVMGSHGRSGLQHLLIGSVAEKVTRKARCPVLIVKDKNARFEMP